MANIPNPNPDRTYPYLDIQKVSIQEYIRAMKEYGLTFMNYDELPMPERKTRFAAGYDFITPVDIDLQPLEKMVVPLGFKVKCEIPGTYFGLHLRSSIATNYGIMLMNNEGIIDADYYNNPSNEGHMFLPIVNLSTQKVHIDKGTRICQGIFASFKITDNDTSTAKRTGGLGSTGK